jgi:hypothetical protein
MFFDQFVNKILKENIISSVPSFQKEEEKPKVVPKKIADIGAATQPLQQGAVPQGQQPTTPQQNQEDPNSAVDELSKQIADAKKAEEERAKEEDDNFAKLIATLTAATQQQQQTTAPQSTSTNPQDVIANLQKLG